VTRFYTAGLGGLKKKESKPAEKVNYPRTQMLFRPYTGRTHQIRVAAKSLGLPILGDSYYGDGSNDDSLTTKGTSQLRTYLHAVALHIQLGEENVSILCPPPFQHFWEEDTFSDLFFELLRKHCDCDQILDIIT